MRAARLSPKSNKPSSPPLPPTPTRSSACLDGTRLPLRDTGNPADSFLLTVLLVIHSNAHAGCMAFPYVYSAHQAGTHLAHGMPLLLWESHTETKCFSPLGTSIAATHALAKTPEWFQRSVFGHTHRLALIMLFDIWSELLRFTSAIYQIDPDP